MFYDVEICSNVGGSGHKVPDIKALREATRLPVAFGSSGACMSLTAAKACIEAAWDSGTATLRLTPEQFAAFNYNRTDNPARFNNGIRDADWWMGDVTVFWPSTQQTVFTVD